LVQGQGGKDNRYHGNDAHNDGGIAAPPTRHNDAGDVLVGAPHLFFSGVRKCRTLILRCHPIAL